MKGMLRQPTWHRWWREFLCDRAIRTGASAAPSADAFRVGLIGSGRVAWRHMYGYLKTGKARVVAVSDPDPKQRKRAQNQWRIPNGYADFHEMLKQEQLDMVSICAPPQFHHPAVIAAAEAGVKAVLCEKPIALNLEQADEMIRACRDHGVALAIGHQRRFGPQTQCAKQLLEERTIGEIRHVIAECPPDVLRAGIHCVDMLLDFLGPLQRVTASLSDGRGGVARAPEEASLSTQSRDRESWIFMEFGSGLQATVRVQDRSSLDAKVIFLGEEGVIEFWLDGGLRYRRSQDKAWTVPVLALNPYLDEFYFEIDSIFSALTSKSAIAVSGEAGRNSLEAVLAILTANHESRSVSLPLNASSVARSPADSI